GLDVKKEEDLAAQFHVNERPSRPTISHEPTGSIGYRANHCAATMQASGAISTVVSATKRVVPIIGDAMVEALRDIARQVRVAKSEHIKLVWVRDDAARQIRWKLERIRNQCKKIIVIGHVESMLLCAVKENVLSEGDAFNLVGIETLRLQLSNNVEEKRFRNGIVLKVSRCHSRYIGRASEIDQK